jgi:hypothetical protein
MAQYRQPLPYNPDMHYVQLSDDPFTDDPELQPALETPTIAGSSSSPEMCTGGCGKGGCGKSGCSKGACDTCLVPFDNLFVKGWIDQGFTGNSRKPENRFNLPVTFNDRANEYQMNQLYVALGKELDVCNRDWDIGGRVDLMYGTDYFFTQALGLETHQDGTNKWNPEGPRFDEFGNRFGLYGAALPQAYLDVLVPFGDATTVKMGHFYTIMGYESVQAPENFFYSHSYMMQYAEPRTQTGVLAATDVGPWTFHYGVTRGWDNFEDPNNELSGVAGLTFASYDGRTSLSFVLLSGKEDLRGENNRTAYSLVLVREVTCNLTYVFQHDFGIEANRELNSAFQLDDAKWYGINNYLYYRVNDKLDLGLRAEWFRDQDNARVLGIPLEPFVTGGNYAELTLGLNWRPHCNVLIRPEVRYDWSDVNPPFAFDGMFRDFSRDEQLTIAVDLVITL